MTTPKPVRKEAKKIEEHVRKTLTSPQSKAMNRMQGPKSLSSDIKKHAEKKLEIKKSHAQSKMKHGGKNVPLKDYHEKKPKKSTRV